MSIQRASLLAVFLLAAGCNDPSRVQQQWVSLELTLAQSSTTAGAPVGYTAELVAASGHRITLPVSLESDLEPALSYTANDLTPVVAGDHAVTASATHEGETFTDTAVLAVAPGEPATLELALSDESVAVDQTVTATAAIADAYGNAVDAPWTLSVEAGPRSDASAATIEGHDVSFAADGWYTAVGRVDQNGVEGRFGPFLVDSFSPLIDIVHPPRGYVTSEMTDTVTGTITDAFSSVVSASVNGYEVHLDEEGNFTADVTYVFGINRVATEAVDEGGAAATDRRAVLAGELAPTGSGIEEGIVARVNQSTIDQIEVFAESMIDDFDAESVIPDPVYENESESCVWGVCVTWYALTLHASNLRRGASDVEIDTNPGGWIDVTVTVPNVAIDWDADAVVTEIGFSGDGTITADSISVSARLTPSVRDGRVHVDVSNVVVSSVNFQFDWDSFIYDAAEFFGIDPSGLIQDYMEGAIEDAVVSMVPPLLEDVLQGLELGTTFELFGNSYALEARPQAITVHDDGMTLALETFLSPVEWRVDHDVPGSLWASYDAPDLPPTPGLLASFSLDFLNQALHGFWGGGVLQQTVDAETIGFDLSMFSLMVEQLEGLQYIRIDAWLPPVVMPGTDGHLADLRAGDIEISFHDGDPDDPSTELLHMFAGLEASLDLNVTDDMTLAAELSDIDAWVDVTAPVLPHNFETETEALIYSLVPLLSGQITSALGEIPIPEIAGFGLADPTISAEPGGGFVTVAGELTGL